MKILVPIKRVPDPYAKVRPLSDGSGLDLSNIKFEINPFDEIAMESAVTQKETHGNIEIISVSIGISDCETQLRKSLAMGADRGVLIETQDQLDPGQIADELKAVVESEGIDLVIMGKQATDDDNNQTGQMLAAKLKWPQATFASKITLENSHATVVRETDLGDETVKVPLPCIITADLRLAEPRYIALPGIIKAKSKPLEKRSRTSSGTSRIHVDKIESSARKSSCKKVGNVDELIVELKKVGAI